jgi:KaiC/GvpD/RAD55 family RecA-like ATPase
LTVRSIGEAFTDYANWTRDPRPRIGFGLPFFDVATNGGMARSEIAMFMASSSVGKTTFALNVIRNNKDVPTLVFELEMNWRMVAARLAAMEVPTTTGRIESDYKDIGDAHPDYIYNVVEQYGKLVCDDTPGISLRDCDDAFEEATEKLGEPPRLVIFDYLELLGGSGMLGKAEQVDKAATKLRDWTRKHDVSTLVLHQVGKGDSREVGSEPLNLASGRYGGHAPMDYVIGAYAPRLARDLTPYEYTELQDVLYMQLLKNRAGAASPTGAKHRFDHRTLRITEWGDLDTGFGYWAPPQAALT